jgi:hypothetical protein
VAFPFSSAISLTQIALYIYDRAPLQAVTFSHELEADLPDRVPADVGKFGTAG